MIQHGPKISTKIKLLTHSTVGTVPVSYLKRHDADEKVHPCREMPNTGRGNCPLSCSNVLLSNSYRMHTLRRSVFVAVFFFRALAKCRQ